jgi:ankyrin repeat protein
VPGDPRALSINALAKFGHFEELRRRAEAAASLDLVAIFERAITDFRTVRRNPGHQEILRWCVEQGLDLDARAGWLNQPAFCLAAMYGNNEFISWIKPGGLPANPFARAAVGDRAFLENYASRHELDDLHDENGFNLLFYCAESQLGRRDEDIAAQLVDTCRFLIDCGVNTSLEVDSALPIFPAFLCAAYGGDEEVMQLLLDHGGMPSNRSHQVVEHSLEPHQRSGDPFYLIAELVLKHEFNINELRPDQGRTLLHGAANRGSAKAVRWLLEHGADPSVLDSLQRTPLHVCAERNTSAGVAKLLVAGGAELSMRDALGRTPLDYARKNNRMKVVEYLISVGAR